MANLKEETIDSLFESIVKPGNTVEFTQEQIERSGNSYMITCAKYEEEERIHQAHVMKNASRMFIL